MSGGSEGWRFQGPSSGRPSRETRSSERHVEKDPKKSQKWRKERLRSRDVEREVGTVRKNRGGMRKSTAESNGGKEKGERREGSKKKKRTEERKEREGKENREKGKRLRKQWYCP